MWFCLEGHEHTEKEEKKGGCMIKIVKVNFDCNQWNTIKVSIKNTVNMLKQFSQYLKVKPLNKTYYGLWNLLKIQNFQYVSCTEIFPL